VNVRVPVTWRLRSRSVDTADHTLVMGIVNVTPDSFSDGGRFVAGPGPADHEAAIAQGRRLVASGADLIDVGGESTRPGAEPVGLDEELRRIVPVVRALAADGVPVSVDTSKPEVARAAAGAGAEIVNDVTGLRDPRMIEVCAETGVGIVIMHMRGEPRTMQDDPTYDDVVAEVRAHLLERVETAAAAGIARERICLDPGIGFGKTSMHNLQLLTALDSLTGSGYPVLLGTSRKRFLGAILENAGIPSMPDQRDGATAATSALAVAAGVAVLRVHDVRSTLEAARVADAIVRSAPSHV
jgi:dihydropteroate synthase